MRLLRESARLIHPSIAEYIDMSLSALAGPLIGAGGAILGGLIGKPRKPKFQGNKQIKYERDLIDVKLEEIERKRRQFGISPLVSAGVPVSYGSPVTVGQDSTDYGIADAAAQIGRGVSDYQSRQAQARENQLNRNLQAMGQAQSIRESKARVQKDQAIANYYNSRAALGNSAAAATGVANDVGAVGAIDVQPSRQTSRQVGHSNIVAGRHAAYKDYEVAPGMFIVAPTSEEGFTEVQEQMWNPAVLIPTVNLTVRKYGYKKAAKALSAMYGIPESALKFILSPDRSKADEAVARYGKKAWAFAKSLFD